MRKRDGHRFVVALLILLAGVSAHAQSSAYKAVLRWVHADFLSAPSGGERVEHARSRASGLQPCGLAESEHRRGGAHNSHTPILPSWRLEMRQNRLMIADQTHPTTRARPTSQIALWDVALWQPMRVIGVNASLVSATLSPSGRLCGDSGTRPRGARVARFRWGAGNAGGRRRSYPLRLRLRRMRRASSPLTPTAICGCGAFRARIWGKHASRGRAPSGWRTRPTATG